MTPPPFIESPERPKISEIDRDLDALSIILGQPGSEPAENVGSPVLGKLEGYCVVHDQILILSIFDCFDHYLIIFAAWAERSPRAHCQIDHMHSHTVISSIPKTNKLVIITASMTAAGVIDQSHGVLGVPDGQMQHDRQRAAVSERGERTVTKNPASTRKHAPGYRSVTLVFGVAVDVHEDLHAFASSGHAHSSIWAR